MPAFLHVPGPFLGETSFTYEAKDASGATDSGTVKAFVHRVSEPGQKLTVDEATNTGFAKDVAEDVIAYRSTIISQRDLFPDVEDAQVISVDGKPISQNSSVDVASGRVLHDRQGQPLL